MLFHLPGMPLSGKRNPSLFFQTIPTHASRLGPPLGNLLPIPPNHVLPLALGAGAGC